MAAVPAGRPLGAAPRRHHERPGRTLFRPPQHACARAKGGSRSSDLSFRYADNLPFLYRGLQCSKCNPGQVRRHHGALGLGQEHAGETAAGLLRARRRRRSRSTATTSATSRPTNCATTSAWCRRKRCCSPARIYDNLLMANPHATFDQVVHACKMAEIHDAIEDCRRATRPRSASAAWACRAGRSSASRSRGRSSSSRRS